MGSGRQKESISLYDKFYSFVDKRGDFSGEEDCWEWTGNFFIKTRYGRLYHHSTDECRAHRIAYLLEHGKIPKGKLICHTCDNRWCVNPKHLYAGTNEDNMDDLANSGILKGSNNPASKLTEEKVLQMRGEYADGKYNTYELAKRYNISQGLAAKIVKGECWKHVGGPLSNKNRKSYKRLTKQELDEICDMFQKGISEYDISRKFDRHGSTINRALRKKGL